MFDEINWKTESVSMMPCLFIRRRAELEKSKMLRGYFRRPFHLFAMKISKKLDPTNLCNSNSEMYVKQSLPCKSALSTIGIMLSVSSAWPSIIVTKSSSIYSFIFSIFIGEKLYCNFSFTRKEIRFRPTRSGFKFTR